MELILEDVYGLRFLFNFYYGYLSPIFTKSVCLPAHTMNSKPVSISDHLKYKYLLSVDGNTSAWQRVPWIMLSGSVLLLVETTTQEWFYRDIIPYTHYVPIKPDFSNLISQI